MKHRQYFGHRGKVDIVVNKFCERAQTLARGLGANFTPRSDLASFKYLDEFEGIQNIGIIDSVRQALSPEAGAVNGQWESLRGAEIFWSLEEDRLSQRVRHPASGGREYTPLVAVERWS